MRGALGRAALGALLVLPGLVAAQSVSLAGHMGRRALLVVDGQTVTLGVGESARGVRLLGLENGQARVEWAGRVSQLAQGGAPVNLGQAAADTGTREIVLSAGLGGHFTTEGQINGRAVHFMVDTGATLVALSQSEAERLGLDYRHGQRAMMQTANGAVPAHQLTLSAVRVGGITIANVKAVVMPAQLPHVLLGNSFLERFQMRRDNDVMRLELR